MFSSLFSRNFFAAGAFTTFVGLAGRSAVRRSVAHCKVATLDLDEDGTEDVVDLPSEVQTSIKSNGGKIVYPWHDSEPKGITMRYQKFKLVEAVEMAPDTKLFRFALKNPDDVFHIPPCSTLQARVDIAPAVQLERFYTPTSSNCTKGHFDIVVRKLGKGRMTNALFNLKPGEDEVEFRTQLFKLKMNKPNKYEQIGMIAGGTGITPMMQVIRHLLPIAGHDNYCKYLGLKNGGCEGEELGCGPVLEGLQKLQAEDKTKLSLLYLNRSESHILWKGYFDELAAKFPDRFRVAFGVDKAEDPSSWKGYTGYATKEMLGATMPPPNGRKNLVLICGPDQLLAHVCGAPPRALEAMHGGRVGAGTKNKQPLGSNLANLMEVRGMLAELGHTQDTVYRF